MTLYIHDLDEETLEEMREKEFSIDENVVHTREVADVYMVFVYHITSMVAIPGVDDIAIMDDSGHFVLLPNSAYHILEVN